MAVEPTHEIPGAEEKPTPTGKMKRVATNTSIGVMVGVVVAWAWNLWRPEFQMTAEVSAAVGGLAGPALRWLVAWLPDPSDD